ncbi:hypothetical protein F5984_24875 [Rudanella paleaurantiibacter]|uniref:Uncharacterized protein n=1 Tax=Rudanella paleaurantiibacter TaxID=2614655 RepID=A0A7J5TSW9_9BACT|nr:hypothetical protein [Rudanella paleaurantiibacter]KAB7726117.1 hypothetical protein F5984_24875 [Rudanella paleaurantiibacter]
MKRSFFAAALLIGLSVGASAQTQTQNTSNGVSTKSSPATGSAEGLNRKGTGEESPKMKSGVSRSGNSNLSPTGPTNTHGSTSEGTGSVRSTGGAEGTGTRQARGGVKGAQNTRNNTANDGGTTGPGATGGNSRNTTRTNEESTSGSTGGSKRPTSAASVQKESRTNDRNVGTGYPEPTGVGKPGTPAGTAKGKKGTSNQ